MCLTGVQKACLAIVGLVTATAVSGAQTPEPAKRPTVHPRLQLAVKTDRKVYSIRDKMRIEVQLRNVGTEGVYVQRSDLCLGSPLASALTMQVLNSSGREVHGVIRDCFIPPPPPKPGEITCDVAEYILMAPSNFFGFIDELKVRDFMPKPGDYTLIIQYQSIMPSDLAPKPLTFPLPYWTSENKPLVSKVHISITP